MEKRSEEQREVERKKDKGYMAILYRHIRLDKNQPFYIGIGNSLSRAYDKYHRNKHWKNIVNKNSYEVEILFDDLTWQQAKEKEKEFIALYGKIENGGILCNMTDGGDGTLGCVSNIEKRKKISSANLNRDSFIYESVASKHRGMKRSNEAKQKMSNVKIRSYLYGMLISNHPFEKFVIRECGTKNGVGKLGTNLGKKFSQETKDKMRLAAKNSWLKRKM